MLVEEFTALEAVVELADHAVEEVALGGCVPVAVLASSPVVGVAPADGRSEARPRDTRHG